MSGPSSARIIQFAAVHNLSSDDLGNVIASALRSAFGDEKSAIKRIMDVSRCEERAAKNWYQGKNAPNALYLLRLIATVPELQAEVRRLTAMQSDLDPHFERAMSQAVELFTRLRRTP